MATKYGIYYTGEFNQAHSLEQIKDSLLLHFKIQESSVDYLLKQDRRLLAVSEDLERSRQCAELLAKCGLQIEFGPEKGGGLGGLEDPGVAGLRICELDLDHSPFFSLKELKPSREDCQLFTDQNIQKFNFEFKGEPKEYFWIWLDNAFKSVLTLGIYSAWAKVRRKKYLYSNTSLDGHAFEYTGNPKAILIGRIIAVALFLIYYYSPAVLYSPGDDLWVVFIPLVLLAFAIPWMMMKSAAFNARNSVYRGIRFQFHGAYWKAFQVYTLGYLLGVLTIGIMMPYAWYWQQKYLVENTSFGQTRFKLQIRPLEYYKVGGYFLVSVLVLWCFMMMLMMALANIFQELTNLYPMQVLVTVVTVLNWILRILIYLSAIWVF
jgi:uncharacterized membrane protein YjgN (DUF898 family)